MTKRNVKDIYNTAPPLWDWRRGDPPDAVNKHKTEEVPKQKSLLLERRCSKCQKEIGFGLFVHGLECNG